MRRRGSGAWLVVAWACLASAVGIVAAPAVEPAVDAAQRDIVVAEAKDPSLRLDLAGHTGEVLALGFFPDGRRLVSGGRDKAAFVWSLADAPGPDTPGAMDAMERARLRERVLRWQVARATRGAIQALAVSPGADSLVAIAGNGAMGSTGEILLVRADDGTYVKTLGGGDRTGHDHAVNAVDFTADGAWLVSRDFEGRVMAWERGADWRPEQLAKGFEADHGPAVAERLRNDLVFFRRPVVAVGDRKVAFATLTNAGEHEANPRDWRPIWQVRVVDLAPPQYPARDLPGLHLDNIEALAATADGTTIASVSGAGKVFVASATGDDRAVTWSTENGFGTALALTPDGSRAVVAIEGKDVPSRIEVREVATKRIVATRTTDESPTALALSRDGKQIAWNGGRDHEVLVMPVAELGGVPATAPLVLGGVGRTITRITFDDPARPRPVADPAPATRDIKRSKGKAEALIVPAPRRIALATRATPAGAWEHAFDIERLAFSPVGEPADWSAPAGNAAGWGLTVERNDGSGVARLRLVRAAVFAASIDLDVSWQGMATDGGRVVSWLTAPGQAEPFAVAIATDRGIGVWRLSADATESCALLRWFRGHEDAVTALAVAPGGEWLASGGRDGLAMVWSLAGIERVNAPLHDRWGIDAALEGGRVVVKAVAPAGPLAGRDVRVGDTIDKVSWRDSAPQDDGDRRAVARQERVDPPAIVTGLAEVPFGSLVAFTIARNGVPIERFQRMPAWENVAALVVRPDDEWALWTPRGYYAASENGDTFFGWLVNRGLDRLPRFHKAKDFRRRLERPDVVSRLLVEGSIDGALRATGRDVPDSSAIVLPRLLAAAPTVRITAPAPGAAVEGETIGVEAEVELPDGLEPERVRAYVSGALAAAKPRLVDDRPADAASGTPRRQRYAWDGVRLPAGERHLVQVFAATRQQTTGLDGVSITAGASAAPRRPRLFFLAAGVDRYPAGRGGDDHPSVPDLDFAVRDARSVRTALAAGREAPFDVAFERLLAVAVVTRAGWTGSSRQLAEACRQADVGPDDILVLFLAGHGITTGGEEPQYAFLCSDLDVRRIGEDPAGNLVPPRSQVLLWDDLAELQDLPCRKLALVDTCHAGALGPGSRGTTLRDFQENLVVVLAAAADDEKSLESNTWGHGAFTQSLLEALGGSADGHGSHAEDGVVTLHEVIDFTLQRVPGLAAELAAGLPSPVGAAGDASGALTRGGGRRLAQNPTVSPESVVPYVRLPLARVPRP
jgi:WD40 repeat protein